MSLPFVIYIKDVRLHLNEEEKLLLSRVGDMERLCEKYARPCFTSFLDGAMQNCIKENIYCGENTMFFGGAADSERNMFGVFPDWEEPSEDAFPIAVVRIVHSYGAELSHRDYLGSVMALGIDRGKIGDIMIDGKTAYIFADRDISEYIKSNLSKIGNKGVRADICEISDITLPQRRFEIINTVAASLRLDAVAAALLKTSRSQAAKLIEGGKVFVNHKEVLKGAYELKVGDLLSVRGFGRAVVEGEGTATRSGRLHITLKKYV